MESIGVSPVRLLFLRACGCCVLACGAAVLVPSVVFWGLGSGSAELWDYIGRCHGVVVVKMEEDSGGRLIEMRLGVRESRASRRERESAFDNTDVLWILFTQEIFRSRLIPSYPQAHRRHNLESEEVGGQHVT